MATYDFDPKDVKILIGGFPMQGFADGEYFSFERTNDAYSMTVGADGDTTRVKSNDRSGTCTITLSQSSPSNDILSALAAADELKNAGVVPIIIKQLGTLSTVFAGNGWVQKMPVLSYGKEVNTRVWVIAMAEAKVFAGGNTAL